MSYFLSQASCIVVVLTKPMVLAQAFPVSWHPSRFVIHPWVSTVLQG